MYFGDTSRLGRPFAKDPAVIRFGGRYLLYYSIPPYAPELAPPNASPGWGIGIAESNDLDHWKKIGELLPDNKRDSAEAKGICAPGALVREGKIHLFYQTYGNGPKDAICHAVSTDGLQFDRNPTNPIFSPTGTWNNGRAIDADVIGYGRNLLLYFSTRDPSGKVQMGGVAAAPIDSDYGRDQWTQLGTGPTLKPELAWERQCIEASALCEQEGRLYMFYAGGYNNEPQQIGVAVSDNGIQWTRLFDTPLLPNGKPGTWNQSESGHPFLFHDADGKYHLFFQGNNDNGRTWYLSRREIVWKGNLPSLL
jgi:beta-1,2-mannobiose phosphorylase / 1,2-beta-oligomannan phosphorylase